MKRSLGMMLALTLPLFVFMPSAVFSADPEPAMKMEAPVSKAPAEAALPEDQWLYTYGEVVSVAANQLVISEYDYEADEEKQAAYAIDSNTKLENAAQVTDLLAGDFVDVYYEQNGEKRLAKTVAKDLSLLEDGDLLEDLGVSDKGEAPAPIEAEPMNEVEQ